MCPAGDRMSEAQTVGGKLGLNSFPVSFGPVKSLNLSVLLFPVYKVDNNRTHCTLVHSSPPWKVSHLLMSSQTSGHLGGLMSLRG